MISVNSKQDEDIFHYSADYFCSFFV